MKKVVWSVEKHNTMKKIIKHIKIKGIGKCLIKCQKEIN
jgi:hypothetical protein